MVLEHELKQEVFEKLAARIGRVVAFPWLFCKIADCLCTSFRRVAEL